MNKKWLPLLILFVMVGGMATLLAWLQRPFPAAAHRIATQPAARQTAVCQGTNLLQNPGFEGPYTTYQFPPPGHPDCQTWDPEEPNQYCERAQMPVGWHPRWLPDGAEEWIIMPEYTASTPDQVNPDRVRSGEKSLHYWSFWTRHESAVHQQVTAVPGVTYCFSAWGHAWSDRISENWYSATPDRPEDDGQLYQKVGIDPTGGTDWQSPTVIWSEARKQYDYFGEFVITATAQAEQITVFIWSRTEVPVKHNEAYWDDAFLAMQNFMQVSPAQISAMATPTQPVTLTQPVQITLSDWLTWTAVLEPNGVFTPTLSASSGTAGESLFVTLSSVGLPLGVYTNTLTIAASQPDVPGSPAVIPIVLHVVPHVERAYLPLILRP